MGTDTIKGPGAVLAMSDPVLIGLVSVVLVIGFVVWFFVMNWWDDRQEQRARQEMGTRWKGLP